MTRISFYVASAAILALSLLACNSQKGFVLEGAIKNAPNLQMTLEQAQFTNAEAVVVGKADADANGNFKINIEEGIKTGIYRLKMGAKMVFLVFDGSEKLVKLTGDLTQNFAYNTVGSPATESYFKTISGLSNGKIDIKAAKEEIANSKQPLSSALLSLQVLGNDFVNNIEAMKGAGAKLNAAMAGASYAKDYSEIIANMEAQVKSQQTTVSLAVGSPAPDISLAGPDGKLHTLSELKGKIVLLDFWASWCGPCRRENPNVVNVYKKYKDRGFTVFSVSLDGIENRAAASMTAEMLKQQTEATKTQWTDAIKKDGLIWENHVSDLKKWDCAPAGVYGVRGIPNTFLIDKAGNIAAINPRADLEEALKKLL